MIKAFAPRESGGCSRVLLSIVLVVGFPLGLRAQFAPEKEEAGAAAKPADPNAAAEAEKPTPGIEIFRDEHAKNFLPNTFQQLGKPAGGNLASQVKNMAGGGAAADRPTIERFVNACIADLTDKNNIRAVIDLEQPVNPNARSHFAIKEATDNLVEPLLTARAANNTGFLSTYNQVLLQLLPPLLENHLLPRISAMIVLSQTASPAAVDLFTKQFESDNQTVWVDLWAARGLTNVAQSTRYNLDASSAMKAAKAISDFLVRNKDKNLPWPVQYRALEALGALRQASTIRPEKGQPEMATTAAQFLTDPDAKLEVRAEAGWALGMMQVPAGISGYNYSLLAYSAGEVTAALAERILEVYSKNPTQAEAWTGVLVSQILQTFAGVEAARDSGLLNATHPAAVQARPFIKQVSDKTKPITGAAVRLVKGAPGQAQAGLKDLKEKAADLKAWLQKNPPANAWLVPNGPKFRLGGAQVANAPGAAAQVVNGPAGRPQ
jgi:hypothetical protein